MPYLTVHAQVSEQESNEPHIRQLSFVTDSDNTTSDIHGVGGTVDRLLSLVAKRVDAYLLRIARRLGHGPSMPAMRVAKAMTQPQRTSPCVHCCRTLVPINCPAPLERRTSDVVGWFIEIFSATCAGCGSLQRRAIRVEGTHALKYCKKLIAFIRLVISCHYS
jgi:hypothetical protein